MSKVHNWPVNLAFYSNAAEILDTTQFSVAKLLYYFI